MATLLELPPEMFERIAECADPQDLLALRLVSTDAASKVLRTYCRAHFSKLRVRLTEEDLNIALDIVDHPQLGCGIRGLVINMEEINWDGRHPYLQLADAVRCFRYIRASREHHLACAEQQNLRHRRLDLHLLITLLCKLKRRVKRLTSIEVVTAIHLQSQRSQPALRFAEDLVPPQLSSVHAACTIIEAIALSGLKFDMYYGTYHQWALPVHIFLPGEDARLYFTDAFKSATVLRLTAWYGCNVSPDRATEFAQTLAGLSQLRLLEFQMKESCSDQRFTEDYMDDTGILAAALLGEIYPSLEDLTLGNISASEDKSTPVWFEELFDFAQRSRKEGKLEYLALENITVIGRAQHIESTVENESLDAMLKRLTGLKIYMTEGIDIQE